MTSRLTSSLVQKVIKRHGAVIDLRRNPQILIEILRELGFDDPPEPGDGGSPIGGAPIPPAPEPPAPEPPAPEPPGPSQAGRLVSNEELMRVLLQLSRDLAAVRKDLRTVATRG
jgi:hypothetical protein